MPKTMMTIMMMMMMMIMTDPFTTNLVVKGPVVKGSVVKGATSITAIVIIITTSTIHPELTRKLSLSSHFIKITFSFRKSVKSVFDKTLSLILSI